MIIAKAPYRISFAGGGTDLPAFYKHEPGAVLSTTIDKHVYVSVHPAFGRITRVDNRLPSGFVENIVHRAIGMIGVHQPLQIGITSDLDSGTGMGGSGALCCGLIAALHKFAGRDIPGSLIAHQAWLVESEAIGSPVGKQDHWASGCGGVNIFRFSGETVDQAMVFPPGTVYELERHCLLCYTGQQRDAGPILEEQSKIEPTSKQFQILKEMAISPWSMLNYLTVGDLEQVARGVELGWESKRWLAKGITNQFIDQWYATAKRAGAWGGKICGAGGGGFMLLIAPPERHEAIVEALQRPRTVPVKFSTQGACVVFDDGVR